MSILTTTQLTGQSESHLLESNGLRLQVDALSAFLELSRRAKLAGFDLRVASGFRSFDRQLKIWNEKLSGQRKVLDDLGNIVDVASLEGFDQLLAVLRFSAMPGASRHHWGTDVDVYDARAMPDSSRLQLIAAEVDAKGVFAAMHNWLDEQIAAGESCGFIRPYSKDLGGVAVERWHLSYAPVALQCQRQFSVEQLRRVIGSADIVGQPLILENLEQLYCRFVEVDESCYQVLS